jgi:hypothetical protein
VADVDTAFMEQILDIAKRQRKTNVQHHREADDPWRCLEIVEWIAHPPRLRPGLLRLKPVSSDNATVADDLKTAAAADQRILLKEFVQRIEIHPDRLQNVDHNEISRFLPLAFLAPDIAEAILNGTQPVDLTIERLRQLPALPYRWEDQKTLLSFSE